MNVLIKNTRIIDPKTSTDKVSDILITDGIIVKIEDNISLNENVEDASTYDVIDAAGLTAFPGLCDIHVHFRDPGWPAKETVESGAEAALSGGVTTVVNMANTNPVTDNPDTIKYILDKAERTPITVLQNSAITVGLSGKEIVDADANLRAGAIGFSDDGIPITDVTVMRKAMEQALKCDKILSLHEELPQLLFSQGVNYGEVSKKVGVAGAPSIAESAIIERDLLLQREIPAHLHFQHLSAARSVELIRQAKKNGQNVTCEVTSQHLTLTEDVVLEVNAVGRINPPIRTESDRQELINGVVDGTIDCIVTDHAPHTDEEKAKPIGQAPSGMIGLETSLAVAFNTLVNGGYIDRIRLAQLMSTNPAALYGIEKGIAVGMTADLILFDENEKYIYSNSVSKSNNSPFLGKEMTGRVKYVFTKNTTHKLD